MATKTAFPPEVMAALKKQTKYANAAKRSSDPFKTFEGPIGRYFARLQRIGVTFSKKDGSANFVALNTCLATVPDSSASSAIPDTQYNGLPMRISQGTAPNENATSAEQWVRVMVLLQSYGLKTKNFGIRNGVEDLEAFWTDLAAAVDLLNARRPAVIIEVTESIGKTGKSKGKTFKNLNVRDMVDEEVVARFGKGTDFEVSDEDLEIPDDDEEGTTSGEGLSEEEANKLISEHSIDEVRASLVEDNVSCGLPIEHLTDAEVVQVAKAFMMKLSIPQFSRPDKPAGAVTVEAGNGVEVVRDAATGTLISGDDEEEDDGPTKDDEEEDHPADKLLKLQLKIGTLTRDQLKQSIRSSGGLKPDGKFLKTQSDIDLQTWLFELKTGKKLPVCVPVPDEVCPFEA